MGLPSIFFRLPMRGLSAASFRYISASRALSAAS